MPELVLLGLVIVALLVERVLSNRDHARERSRLLNRLEAKNAAELVVLNQADEPAKPKPVPDPNKRVHIPIGL